MCLGFSFIKPVLKLGEHLLREHISGIFVEPKKKFGEHSSGFSSNCNEAIFGVQKASLNMFSEYIPHSANLASDWLRAKRALLWMRKK